MAARVGEDIGSVVLEDSPSWSVDMGQAEGAIVDPVVVEAAEAMVVAQQVEEAIEVAAVEGSLRSVRNCYLQEDIAVPAVDKGMAAVVEVDMGVQEVDTGFQVEDTGSLVVEGGR